MKKWKRITAAALCLIAALGIAACNSPSGNSSGKALQNVTFPKAYAFDDYEARRTVRESNPVGDSFVASTNEFAYKTAAQLLTGSEGNANYLPLSLYFTLAVATTGANGGTADGLLSLLGASDKAELSRQSGNLYRFLHTDNKVGKLKIANSLWMNKDFAFKQDFVKNAAENFYSEAFNVDFTDEKTARNMSKWISDNTNGKLAPEMQFDSDILMTILNTIYFYDEWSNSFNENSTAKDDFNLPDGGTVSCDFMNATYQNGEYAIGDRFTRASLFMKNGNSMVFILPDEGVSPRELLATPEKTREVFEGGETGNAEIIWQIPKFEFRSGFDIIVSLRDLGVQSAFETDADFSGMTDEIAFISKIIQETYIKIDEKGVEAAAYTRIDLAGGAAMPPPDTVEMILDRPFIFGIYAPNGTLLFTGICDNPSVS